MNEQIWWAATTALTMLISITGYLLKRSVSQLEKHSEAQDRKIAANEERLNEAINQMPYLYTLREDFIRAQANTDRKLDSIIKLLNKRGDSDDR
jgi:hypothetical protein